MIRVRRTPAEIATLRSALYDAAAELQPLTVRGLFYALTVRGAIDKTEAGYKTVVRVSGEMRRRRELPFSWLTDGTRLMRKPRSWETLEDYAHESAQLFRRALWAEQSTYVEVWCEKDALTSVLYPVTAEWDAPLMVSRGNASLSFLMSAAEDIVSVGKPTTIYVLTDYDPGGERIAAQIERDLGAFVEQVAADARHEHAPAIAFHRLAVTVEQIAGLNLPTRPTKASDVHAARHGPISVELDAIEAPILRAIVSDAITAHIDRDALERSNAIEEAEAETLRSFAESLASMSARRRGDDP